MTSRYVKREDLLLAVKDYFKKRLEEGATEVDVVDGCVDILRVIEELPVYILPMFPLEVKK